MKSIRFWLIVTILFTVWFAPKTTVKAQTTSAQCGDILKGEFTQLGDSQRYTILMGVGDKLEVVGKPETESLRLSILISGPANMSYAAARGNGNFESRNASVDQNPQASTNRLSAFGIYTITVANNLIDFQYGTIKIQTYTGSSDGGLGTYQILISCNLADGTQVNPGDKPPAPPTKTNSASITLPIMQARSLPNLQCGSILAAEYTKQAEVHFYTLEIGPNEKTILVRTEPIGDYLYETLEIFDPSKKLLGRSDWSQIPSAEASVTSTGKYRISIANTNLYDDGIAHGNYVGGIGAYAVFVSCTTKDGQTINAGDNVTPTPQPPTAAAPAATTVAISSTLIPTTDDTTADPSCPNSPPTRLAIGGKGKITPGQANNVRSTPTGRVISKIPGGSEVEILDGPQCGSENRMYWKVQYQSVTGWTAEGEGTEYWIEPVEEGRG